MRYLITVIVLCLTTTLLLAQTQPDFRTIHWGMTREEVQQNETTQPCTLKDSIKLCYDVNLGNIPSKLFYLFNNKGKAVGAKYKFIPEYANPDFYLYDYDDLLTVLNKKYGHPDYDEENWDNRVSNRGDEVKGQALLKGEVSYIAGWQVAHTEIKLSLTTIAGKTIMEVDYISTNIDNLSDPAYVKRLMKDL